MNILVYSFTSWLIIQAIYGLPKPVSVCNDAVEPKDFWVSIRSDHWDRTSSLWNMRFAENGKFFKAGGPMFIMLGDNYNVTRKYVERGLMHDMAKEHTAYLYALEHRFYGGSLPTKYFSLEDFELLTARQALADVIEFIDVIKINSPAHKDSKAVVFGGGYAGNLATWMRSFYPDRISGAVAVSAPLLHVVDFPELFEDMVASLDRANPECVPYIKAGVEAIKNNLYNQVAISQTAQDFSWCSIPQSDTDYFLFFTYLSEIISRAFLSAGSNLGEFCIDLMALKDPYKSLANLTKKSIDEDCITVNYEKRAKYFRDENNHTNEKAWLYQRCKDFGGFSLGLGNNDFFKGLIPSDFYHKMCKDVFGDSFDLRRTEDGVKTTNLLFGGLKPNATKVVTVNGSLDPYRKLGLLQDLDEEMPVRLVNGAGYCEALETGHSNNELITAQGLIRNKIDAWLK